MSTPKNVGEPLLSTDGKHRREGQPLLSLSEIDAVYHEPFILSGYRSPCLSWLQCMQHVFVLHNDVINFWTHFIPLLLFVVWFIVLVAHWENFFQVSHYPLMCFWIGACSYTLFSSVAHLFSCKSFLVRTVCFILDYLGIAMYALGSDIAYLFYLSPASSCIYQYKGILISLEVGMSVLATLLCGLSRFYWRDARFVIRAFAFILPYCCALGPYLNRLYACWKYSTDCVPETFFWHMSCVLFCLLLAFFFVTKIPERFYPGRFDRFFHSHQLFHVFAAFLTFVQMYSLPLEVTIRREVLRKVEGASPTWWTTLFPFMCAEVLGLLTVFGLGYLTKIGVLTTNKYRSKKMD